MWALYAGDLTLTQGNNLMELCISEWLRRKQAATTKQQFPIARDQVCSRELEMYIVSEWEGFKNQHVNRKHSGLGR